MPVERDPRRIAACLEQTRLARLNNRPSSYAEAAEQILRHSWEAGQITEAQFRQRLKNALAWHTAHHGTKT